MSIIFFDLDGTLAPVGLPVPEAVADGMRCLEQNGHRVAVCSGKPLAYLCGMLRQIGLKQPLMAGENGAAVQFGVDLPPVQHRVLPYPEEAKSVLALLRARLEESFGESVWFQPNEHMLTCFPYSQELFDPIAELIASFGPEQVGLVVYRHGDCFDIIPEGTDKGAAVSELCSMLGASPEQCIAVGDHCNDLPMFRTAGLAISVGSYNPPEAQMHFQSIEKALGYLLEL